MSVEATLNNFEALSEFWNHNDTCGEDAFLMIEHLSDGRPLDGPDVDAIRADMAAHGMSVAGGTTMSELCDYFARVRGLPVAEVCHYGAPLDAIHAALLAHAGRDGVVVQVNRASNLTDNESGVNSHFVAIGGIHPTLGYLVGNGDDVRALNINHGHGKTYPARWMSWATLASAEPVAVAVISGIAHTVVTGGGPTGDPTPTPSPAPTPTPEPSTPGTPGGWSDDGTTLTGPNGVPVVHGFRLLVLASGLASNWPPSNVPLAAEAGDTQSSYQPFAEGVATWTSGAQPVYAACAALANVLAPGKGGGPDGADSGSGAPSDVGEVTGTGSGTGGGGDTARVELVTGAVVSI